MNMLTEKELNDINGGAIKLSAGGFLVAGGFFTFLIGLVNGYLRPLTCSSAK